MEVIILEVCKVTPPLDSLTDDISLPLTFFDLYNIIFSPVGILFFYETPPQHSHPILISKLKHSLTLTLRHFLPAAGNLVWPHSSPNPVIRYRKGDSILLTIAQSDGDFYHLSGKQIRTSKKIQPLVARIDNCGTQAPLIAFKITLFPDTGICIGVTVHHSLFDAASLTLFMNSWASFVKFDENRGSHQDLTPVFDRKHVREQYPELESLYLEILKQNGFTSGQSWPDLEPARSDSIVRQTFILSALDVMKLKGIVRTGLENNDQVPRVTTFSAAYAYVIVCLVKVKPPKSNRVNVSFAFDCRQRLKPPLPKNYFGNCVGPCDAYFTTEELLGMDGMAVIVNFISTATKKLDDGAPLEGAEEWLPNMFRSFADTETMRIFVAGSSRFDYQSVDFGWGRPRKVDIASIEGSGGVIFTQGGDENKGGIEVELSLEECEMERYAYIFDQGLINMESP